MKNLGQGLKDFFADKKKRLLAVLLFALLAGGGLWMQGGDNLTGDITAPNGSSCSDVHYYCHPTEGEMGLYTGCTGNETAYRLPTGNNCTYSWSGGNCMENRPSDGSSVITDETSEDAPNYCTISAPTCSLTVDNKTSNFQVVRGESVNVNWRASGDEMTVSMTGAGINSTSSTGNTNKTLNSTTTFSLRAENDGGTCEKEIEVTVTDISPRCDISAVETSDTRFMSSKDPATAVSLNEVNDGMVDLENYNGRVKLRWTTIEDKNDPDHAYKTIKIQKTVNGSTTTVWSGNDTHIDNGSDEYDITNTITKDKNYQFTVTVTDRSGNVDSTCVQNINTRANENNPVYTVGASCSNPSIEYLSLSPLFPGYQPFTISWNSTNQLYYDIKNEAGEIVGSGKTDPRTSGGITQKTISNDLTLDECDRYSVTVYNLECSQDSIDDGKDYCIGKIGEPYKPNGVTCTVSTDSCGGGGTPTNPTPNPTPPNCSTGTFNASPRCQGTTPVVDLSWSIPGATSVRIPNLGNAYNYSSPQTDTSPNTSYTLTAYNSDGQCNKTINNVTIPNCAPSTPSCSLEILEAGPYTQGDEVSVRIHTQNMGTITNTHILEGSNIGIADSSIFSPYSAPKDTVFGLPTTPTSNVQLRLTDNNGKTADCSAEFQNITPAPSCTITPATQSIALGERAELDWAAHHFTPNTINVSPDDVEGFALPDPNQNVTVKPTSTGVTTYTITLNQNVQCSATVNVEPVDIFECPLLPSGSRDACSDTHSFSWNLPGATVSSPEAGALPSQGNTDIVLNTIIADYGNGNVCEFPVVYETGPQDGPCENTPPTCTAELDKTSIDEGQSVLLSWTSTRANRISVNNNVGTVAPPGNAAADAKSIRIDQAGTYNYTVTATQTITGQSTTCSAGTVTVKEPAAPNFTIDKTVNGKTSDTIDFGKPAHYEITLTGDPGVQSNNYYFWDTLDRDDFSIDSFTVTDSTGTTLINSISDNGVYVSSDGSSVRCSYGSIVIDDPNDPNYGSSVKGFSCTIGGFSTEYTIAYTITPERFGEYNNTANFLHQASGITKDDSAKLTVNEPICNSFTVNNSRSIEIIRGEDVRISWDTEGLDAVDISSIGNGLSSSGNHTFSPSRTSEYTLTGKLTGASGDLDLTFDNCPPISITVKEDPLQLTKEVAKKVGTSCGDDEAFGSSASLTHGDEACYRILLENRGSNTLTPQLRDHLDSMTNGGSLGYGRNINFAYTGAGTTCGDTSTVVFEANVDILASCTVAAGGSVLLTYEHTANNVNIPTGETSSGINTASIEGTNISREAQATIAGDGAPSCSNFTAPTSVDPRTPIDFHWDSTNQYRYSISDGNQEVMGAISTSKIALLESGIQEDTTFTLSISNAAGYSVECPNAITVSINDPQGISASIIKTVDKDPATYGHGESIAYEVRVTNTGDAAVTVDLTDTMRDGVTSDGAVLNYVPNSMSISGGSCGTENVVSGETLNCTLSNNGDFVTVVYEMTVDTSSMTTSSTTIDNTAAINYIDQDGDPWNITWTATVTIIDANPQCLSFTAPTPVDPSTDFDFTWTALNQSSYSISNGSSVVLSGGSGVDNATQTDTLFGGITQDTDFTLTITGPDGGTDTCPAFMVNLPPSDVSVTKSAEHNQLQRPNMTTTYTIEVTNNTDFAQDIFLEDYISDTSGSTGTLSLLGGVAVTKNGQYCSSPDISSEIFTADCSFPANSNGDSIIFEYVMQGDDSTMSPGESTTIENTVDIYDPNDLTTPLDSAIASIDIIKAAIANFDVTKSVSPLRDLTDGEIATYTITVDNVGSTQQTVNVADVIAALDSNGGDLVFNDDITETANTGGVTCSPVTGGAELFTGSNCVFPAGSSITWTYTMTADTNGMSLDTTNSFRNTVTVREATNNTLLGQDSVDTTITTVESLYCSLSHTQPVFTGETSTLTWTVNGTPATGVLSPDDLTNLTGDAYDVNGTGTGETPVLTAPVTYMLTLSKNGGSETFTCATTISPRDPSATIAKSANPVSLSQDEVTTYTLTITNNENRAVDYSFEDQITNISDGGELVYVDSSLQEVTTNTCSNLSYDSGTGILSGDCSLAANQVIRVQYQMTAETLDPALTAPTSTVTNTARLLFGSLEVNSITEDVVLTEHIPEDYLEREKTVSVNGGADLTITTADETDTLTYTLTVRNTGIVDYTGDFSDDLSDILQYIDSNGIVNISDSGTMSGNTVEWTGIDVNASSEVQLTFEATIAAATDWPGAPDDLILRNFFGNEVLVFLPGSVQPDYEKSVAIDRDGTPVAGDAGDPAQPGDVLSYTLTLTNNSTINITGYTFQDSVNDVLRYADIDTISDGGSLSGDIVSWGAVDIDANSSVTHTFVATVRDASTWTAYDPADPNMTNIFGDKTVTVILEPLPEISYEKLVDRTAAQPGDTVNYTIRVTNNGLGDASDIVVVDELDNAPNNIIDYASNPINITNGGVYDSGNQTLTWTVDIPAESFIDLNFSVVINEESTWPVADPHEMFNSVEGSDTTVVIQTEPPVVVSIDKVEQNNVTSAVPGDTVTYEITVTNEGTEAVSNIIFVDDYDETQAEMAPNTLNQLQSQGCTINGDVIECTIAQLAAAGDVDGNDSVTITYDMYISDAADTTRDVVNTVTLTEPTENDSTNTTSTWTIDLSTNGVDIYDLEVSEKTGTPNPFDLSTNTTIDYTISYRNAGNMALPDVVLIDDYDETAFTGDPTNISITHGSCAVTDDGSGSNQIIECTMSSLPRGASGTITYTATVDTTNLTVGDEIYNVVTGEYLGDGPEEDNEDNDPTNNWADETVTLTSPDITAYYKTVENLTQGGSAGDSTSAVAGDVLRYTLSIEGAGGTDVTITDNIAEILQFGSITDNGGGNISGNSISWSGAIDNSTGLFTVSFDVTIDNGAAWPDPWADMNGENYLVQNTYMTETVDVEIIPNIPAIDVGVVKTATTPTDPTNGLTAYAGEVVTYTLTVTNHGSENLTDVAVVDTNYPSELQLTANTETQLNNQDCGYSTGSVGGETVGLITCSISTLDSGETVNITYDLRIPASATSTDTTVEGDGAINIAEVIDPNNLPNTGTDENSENQQSEHEVDIIAEERPRYDLRVWKEVDDTIVQPGQTEVTYTLTYSNEGTQDLTNVVLTDTFDPAEVQVTPAEVQFTASGNTSIDPVCAVDNGAGTIICTIDTLPGTATGIDATEYTITYTVDISASLIDGRQIDNTFEGSHDDIESESNTSDNSITVTIVVDENPDDSEIDLSLNKTANISQVDPGGNIGYTLSYQNRGDADAHNVVITDEINTSRGSFNTPISGCTVATVGSVERMTCSIGFLAANSNSRTISYSVRVANGATGTFRNDAEIDATENDPNPGNNTDSVNTPITIDSGEIELTKEVKNGRNQIVGGEEVTFIITATNGTNSNQSFTITDTVSGGTNGGSLDFVRQTAQFSPSTAGQLSGSLRDGSVSISNLLPGSSVTISATYKGNNAGIDFNQSSGFTNTASIPSENLSAIASVRVTGPRRGSDDGGGGGGSVSGGWRESQAAVNLNIEKYAESESGDWVRADSLPSAATVSSSGEVTVPFRVVVTNSGSVSARNVVIQDSFDSQHYELISIHDVTGAEYNAETQSFDIRSIPGSSDVEILYFADLRVIQSDDLQVAINTASITSAGSVADVSPLLARGNTKVNGVGESDDAIIKSGGSAPVILDDNRALSFKKTVNKRVAEAGEYLIYNIIVFNRTNADYHNLVITDTFPFDQLDFVRAPELDNVDMTTGTLTFQKDELKAGDIWTITIEARIRSEVQNGTLVKNVAVINADEDIANTRAEVQTLVEKEGVVAPVELNKTGSPLATSMLFFALSAAIFWWRRKILSA